jgi:dienelactone hydrolase
MDPQLPGWERFDFTNGTTTRSVYRSGTGPAVLVIHEVPGITPKVAAFGRRVVDAGFTVAMPSLFGTPGRANSGGYALGSMLGGCVSREFHNWALSSTSPMTVWCRALAARMHEECGGPGVGAVGMCFTGGFALAMMVDDRMLAPVLSQPSLPFPVGAKRKRDLAISDSDLACIKQRAAQGQPLMGLRFTGDPFVPAERFARLREELGDRFLSVEIDSSPGNQWGFPRVAHSVLTEHLVDEPGNPTRDALDGVLAFFAERLRPDPGA